MGMRREFGGIRYVSMGIRGIQTIKSRGLLSTEGAGKVTFGRTDGQVGGQVGGRVRAKSEVAGSYLSLLARTPKIRYPRRCGVTADF